MTDARILELIKERLLAIIDRELPELTPSTQLRDELGLNSLDAVDLVIELEELFEIELDDEEMSAFENVGDIISAVKTRLGQAV